MESSNLFQTLSSSSQSPAPPFAFIGVTALILIYVVVFYLVIDFNEDNSSTLSRAEDHSSSTPSRAEDRRSGLSLEKIRELPWFHCEVNFAATCAVCLDGVHKGERCRFFPHCKHIFHAQCIDPWLMRKLTCPTCRSPFKLRANLDIV